LEQEWTEGLRRRREHIDNPKEYAKIFLADINTYESLREVAINELLKAHKISRKDYDNACDKNKSLQLENQIADIVWTYWAFKNSGFPKTLTKEEFKQALVYQLEIAMEHRNNFADLLKKFNDAPESHKHLKLATTWMAEMMHKKHNNLKAEEFILSCLDKSLIEDPDIEKSMNILLMEMTHAILPDRKSPYFKHLDY